LVQNLQSLEVWAVRTFNLDAANLGIRWSGIYVISGHRSRESQAQVNPDAPSSLHTRCPSLAVDLRVGNVPGLGADAIWEWLGARWKWMGGRWGGDFTGGQPGINRAEQNHFDLGVGT